MSVEPEDEQRIAAYFAGELDERALAQLRERLRADAALRARFAEVASDELALREALGSALPRFVPPRATTLSPSRRWLRFAAAAALLAAVGTAAWWLLRAPRDAEREGAEARFHIVEGTLADARALTEARVFDAPAGLRLELGGTRVEVLVPSRLAALPPEKGPRDPRDRERSQLAVLHGKVDVENPAGRPGLRLLTPAGVLRDLGTRFTVEVEAQGGPAEMASLSSRFTRFAAPALVTAAVLAGAVGFEAAAPRDALAQEQVLRPEMGAVALSADNSIARLVDREGLAHRRELGSERWTRIEDDARFLPGTWLATGTRGAHALRVKLAGGAVLTLGPGAQLELVDASRAKLHAGEARVQSADEQRAVAIEGPGSTLEVRGTRYLRARDGQLATLDEAPRWLDGYESGRPTEALGALLAQIDGRAVPLSIGYHKVNVDLKDQIARTTIDQSFVNHTSAVLEGTFYFPLPEDASVSSFSLLVNGRWIEGEVVEKERARQIYETLLREKRDPGLLEWSGGNLFQARIYPIHGEKRVKIVYTQVLPRTAEGVRYRYPLKSELTTQRPLQRLELDVTIASSEEILGVECASHSCRIQSTAHAARVEHSASEVIPRSDFEVLLRTQPQPLRFLPHRRGDDGYFALLFDAPREQNAAAPTPGEWIFVCDTSGSSESASEQQLDALDSLLRGLSPADRFQLAAFDVETAWAFDGYRPASDATREQALNFLAARMRLGWTRFEPAFEQVFARANAATRIVYLGDGIASGGERNLGDLLLALERAHGGRGEVHAIGIGAKRDRRLLEGLARMGGTVHVLASDADPSKVAEQALRAIAAPGLRDLELRFEGLSTAAVHPAQLARMPAGEQSVVLGRFDPATASARAAIVASARRADGSLLEQRLELDASRIDASNDFVPRLWARRRLDHLLEQSASPALREHIIALSEDFQILTPYTSFLVLETEADRERFDVEKKMRLRDGELFFAAAREDAQAALQAQALRDAKAWRQGLRAQFLRSIRELGRERMAELRLDEVEELALGEKKFSLPPRGGGGGPRGSRLGKAKGGDYGTESLKLAESEDFDQGGAWDSEESTGEEYLGDIDIEFSESMRYDVNDAVQDKRSDLRARRRLRDQETSVALRALGYAGDDDFTRGKRGWSQEGGAPAILRSHFPGIGSAVLPAEFPAHWPAEVQTLLRALDRRAIVDLASTGLHLKLASEVLDARERIESTRRSELLLAAEGWHASGHGTFGEGAPSSWVAGTQRAALDPRWSLGRTRRAVPSDRRDWPSPMPLLFENLAALYAGYEAELLVRESGERVLLFRSAAAELAGSSHQVELVLDAERAFVRERRVLRSGALVSRELASEPLELAGLLWPTRVEVQDGEGRPLARWSCELSALEKERAERELAQRCAFPPSSIVLGELPSDVLAALDAARAQRATPEQLVLLVERYGAAGRWEIASPYASALFAAMSERTGAKRLELSVALAKRETERARVLLLELARELATGGRAADAAAVADLDQLAGFAAPGERLELAAFFRAVEGRQQELELRLRSDERELALQHELERVEEAFARRQSLAAEHPENLDLQFSLVHALAGRDRLDAALAHLATVRERAPWRFHERASCTALELELLWNARRWPSFVERFTALERSVLRELPASSFERLPTALLHLDRLPEADRAILAWLEAGAVPGADEIALRRLDAAIAHALGRANGLWRARFDERFEAPLAAFVRTSAERPEHASRVQRILEQDGFRETATGEAWLQVLLARLEPGTSELALGTAVRFARWARYYREFSERGERFERTLLERLLARFESAELRDESEELGSLLARAGKPEERARYWTKRLSQARSTLERDIARAALFDAVLTSPWSDAVEARLFALWPELHPTSSPSQQPELAALAARLERARALWRITEMSVQQRVEAKLAARADRDTLDRRALKSAREAATQEERAALAKRLSAIDAASLPADLARWLACEVLYFEVRSGAPRGEPWQRAWTLLQALPNGGAEQPEQDAVALAERLLATAAWFVVLGGIPEEEGLQRVLTWLRARQRGERELFEPRLWESRLLLGADRGAELVQRLAAWFGTGEASVEAPWGFFLAHIQAETDALDAAVATLQRVAERTPPERAELELLATWQRARGDEAAVRAARDRAWAACSEGMLAAWLDEQADRVRARRGGVPENLDPEAPRALAALLRKAEHPMQYAWLLRNLYGATRDPRLFAGLAEGVLGTTASGACELLNQLHDLVREELQEESAVDVAAAAVAAVRAGQPSAIDLRCVEMLELMLRARAVELRALDRTHLDAALAAFDRVERGTWAEGEALSCASWLASFGKIASEALRERILRQLVALERALPEGSTDRPRIALQRAQWLWAAERFDDAIAAREAAVAMLASAHGGRLPDSMRNELSQLTGWLAARARWVDAERLLEADLAAARAVRGSSSSERERWAERELFQLEFSALEARAATALGRGFALWEALERRCAEVLERADDPQHVSQILVIRMQAWKTQGERDGKERVLASLLEFSRGALLELLARHRYENGQDWVGTVANTLHQVGGATAALRFFVERAANEPARLARAGDEFWSNHSWRFGQAVEDAGRLDDELHARVLEVIVRALRTDLRSQHQNARWCYSKSSRFYARGEARFLAVAREIFEERGAREGVAMHVASYLLDDLASPREASEMLLAAERRGILRFGGRYLLARALQRAERHGEAADVYAVLVQERPELIDLHTGLLRSLFAANRREEVRAAWTRSLATFGERAESFTVDVRMKLGWAALDANLLLECVAILRDAIQIHTRSSASRGIGDGVLGRAYQNLALALARLGRTSEAIDAAAGALIAYSPRQNEQHEAQQTLRQVLRDAEDLRAVIAAIDAEALRSGQENPILRRALGEVLGEKGDRARAAEQLLLAAELVPEDEELQEICISALDLAGRRADAEARLLDLARSSTSKRERWIALGSRYAGRGDAANAERARTSLVEAAPLEAEGYAVLAAERERMMDSAQALAQWTAVAELETLAPRGALGRARALLALGRMDDARAELQALRAKRFGPEHAEVLKELPLLEARLPR
ncbi:MAG: FecR domain-containing protein [Planctomycetes bacterium]|nr:FecR domain-containing protein [Planctomycetota bacterium]